MSKGFFKGLVDALNEALIKEFSFKEKGVQKAEPNNKGKRGKFKKRSRNQK